MSSTLKRVVVLFRQDLRLSDNPALYNAYKDASEVIPLYILEDGEEENNWPIRGAQKWWLHHSLNSLSSTIQKNKGKLILRRGKVQETLLKVFEETKANTLYMNHCHEPFVMKRDEMIKIKLKELDINTKMFESTLLFDPSKIKTKSTGTYFKVYTSFFNECVTNWIPRKTLPEIKSHKFSTFDVKSDQLEDWELLPTKPNWAKGFEDLWQPGEEGAQKNLTEFIKYIKNYKVSRDRPDNEHGTSHLSPHLHFGEISPALIWETIHQECKLPNLKKKETGPEVFLSQILWREFFYHLIHHFPNMGVDNYNPRYDKFKWIDNKDDLKAWKKGLTGFPIVDAGMRELWHTGNMHNRLRMIVGSFLVKDLLIDWREGEKWFGNCLLDADLPNNAGGWQWVAGSGTDAAQYTRVFNPTLQGEKFDPDCVYIKKWVPELKNLPNEYIHAPWTTPKNIATKAGITFGKDYPKPIVDHGEARLRALKHYDEIREKKEKRTSEEVSPKESKKTKKVKK
jgi:deoxyribodipyrimidine photo-lyase